MAKLQTVQKARKPNQCGRCQRTIEIGESYFHWSVRSGSRFSKKVRCADHKPRPSEYASNQYQQMILGALEGFEDASPYANGTELAEALRAVAETATEISETLEQNAESMEDGFGHETEQTSEMRERADAWREWAEAIEEKATDAESDFPDDEMDQCDECGIERDQHTDDEDEEAEHDFDEKEISEDDYTDVLGEQPE